MEGTMTAQSAQRREHDEASVTLFLAHGAADEPALKAADDAFELPVRANGPGFRSGEKGTPGPQPARSAQDVLGFELPVALIGLDDLIVRAVSEAALKRLGASAGSVLGHSALDLLDHQSRASAQVALAAMGAGAVDFYRSFGQLAAPEPSECLIWVRAVDFAGERVALAEVASGSGRPESALTRHLGREPLEMAVGSVGTDWVITCISSDIETILGFGPEEAVGRHLFACVHEIDVGRLLDASLQAQAELSVALSIRFRDVSNNWVPVRCVLTAVGGSRDRCLMLVGEPDSGHLNIAQQATRLEQHLWKIAAEVEASGILQQSGRFGEAGRLPKMGALTTKQWEVFSRVVRGERVPEIASGLFISQSTVRNHLSAIFEVFGVHSQSELLVSLRKVDGTPS
jgi:DNA-binding CsgD family transcriptional regulator